MPLPEAGDQKAPSTRRCIKTRVERCPCGFRACQKAPSTRRCIKTSSLRPTRPWLTLVRKHPAPECALRPATIAKSIGCGIVRKHPAPEGALRQTNVRVHAFFLLSQKAPSTRRCIKTTTFDILDSFNSCQKATSTRRCIETSSSPGRPPSPGVRKHPAPEGALRRSMVSVTPRFSRSESTQHQKVHLDLLSDDDVGSVTRQKTPRTRRCIKTEG